MSEHIDITYLIKRLEELEQKINERNEYISILFDNAPIGLTVFDENFKYIDCNDAVLSIFGITREHYSTFFGSTAHSPEFQPDGSRSHDKAMDIVKSVMGGEDIKIEWVHLTPDGKPLPAELTLTRIKQDDKFVGLGYIYDLRNRKRLEKALINAKEDAEQSSRFKSSFLANMSHEIRTPLNAILGITEIQLQRADLEENSKDALSSIYESGSMLMGIINDILDLSKIEAGKLEILPVAYEIPNLINDTMQLNLSCYTNKPIKFVLEIDEYTPYDLQGDELRIKQILNNILSNAYKYTKKGEIIFSIQAIEIPPSSKYGGDEESWVSLIFRVSDTGLGMSKKQVEEIFDEYSRFNTDSNRTTIGTGLGMSITKRLTDLMNGTITVESELGVGTTFTVELPQKVISEIICGAEIADRIQNTDIRTTAIDKKLQLIREYMPYGKVLVVDDVQSNIYVTRGMLLPYGLEIDTADNGFEVLNKVKSGNTYDIIFMDHMMPKMDGIETTAIIRNFGYTNPIVALTANALVGQSEMFLQHGFDGYLSKPIDSRELNSVLIELIKNKQPPEVVKAASRGQREKREKEVAAKSRGHDGESHSTSLEKLLCVDVEQTITTLEDLYMQIQDLNDADIGTFTVTVHGIKSVLAYFNETELSDLALSLEKAGNARDIDAITYETPIFIDALRSLIKRIKG